MRIRGVERRKRPFGSENQLVDDSSRKTTGQPCFSSRATERRRPSCYHPGWRVEGLARQADGQRTPRRTNPSLKIS